VLVHGRPHGKPSGRPGDEHVHVDADGHEHPHGGRHRREQPHVPQRGAVLDIGGDVGAVLVVVGPALDGAEIELYDEHGNYVMHTEVHGRDIGQGGEGGQSSASGQGGQVGGKRQYAGLFPSVRAGTYLLDTADGAPRERVVVTGGEVARVARVAGAAPA
jgi:hypothetical protein